MDCMCWNFINRRIKKSGALSDIVYYAEPCKHLKEVVNALISVGYTIKEPRDMEGTDKCTAELRKFIMERSGGFCEMKAWDGGCKRPGIEVHRKVSKTNGGKYSKSNCILLCEEHHELVTFQKWHGNPGSNPGQGIKNEGK